MTTTTQRPAGLAAREVLTKVPQVTLYFWIIKVLCTTVGETAADLLNTSLGIGLTGTSIVMTVLFAAVLAVQFRLRRYVPGVYWLTVVLISVVGTLLTDNLTDNLGVPLEATTAVFAVALAAVFGLWYAIERTLSIHSIHTRRREAFYWLAILVTFALGTAAGDLTAERFGVGYWLSAALFGALIAVVAAACFGLRLNAVVAFWIAYVLTRPLGASLGDGLAQPGDAGGVGLGTVVTSMLFLAAILLLVVYLSWSRRDQPSRPGLASTTSGVVEKSTTKV